MTTIAELGAFLARETAASSGPAPVVAGITPLHPAGTNGNNSGH
jgi:hypothetical protein